MRKEVLAEGVERDWVTIYALCDPVERWKTGAVRYVGKTGGVVWHRIRHHSYAARRGSNLPVHRWLRKHIDAGDPFHIIHLERVPQGADWASRERYWIEKFRSEAVKPLLNLSSGGEGLSGHAFSIDHRSKIAAALRRGASFACETCGTTFWRKPRDIARGHNRFCSRRCYQSWQIGKPKVQHHVA